MASLKEVKQTGRRIWWIAGIAIAAVALIIGVCIFIFKSGFFYKKVDTGAVSFTMTDQMNEVVNESEMQKGYLHTKLLAVLQENRGIAPWILDWVVIPGTTRSVPGFQSGYVDTIDQILLLETYIQDGKKSSAEKLMKAIDAQLADEKGYLTAYAKVSELGLDNGSEGNTYEGNDIYEDRSFLLMEKAPASLQASSLYLRVLMDFYDKWGSEKLLEKIESLAELLAKSEGMPAYRAENREARATPIPVSEILAVTPTPTPTPDPEKQEERKLVFQEGLELPGLDLLAMKRASAIDPKYEKTYEEWLKLVKNGKVSDVLPLFAWMYVGDGNYTFYAGGDADVELVPSLYVILHLAEVGELDPDSYSWVQMQVLNTGFLYTKYNMFSGAATSEVEAYEAYPLVLELAVIKNDEALFKAAYNAMMRQYATLSSSQILHTLYRDVENSRIELRARENLLAEIFLR
ncbi:MAG: hypothetical protein IKD90_11565 [Clostridiales bacterium]|nr:hypothetical protein [Clostridiales bacterium]